MARRCRRDKLLGNFFCEGGEKIVVADEKRQMDIVGDGIKSYHFNRKHAPVFKKAPQARQGQAPFPQPRHKRTLADSSLPVAVKLIIQMVDVCFSLCRFHEKQPIGQEFGIEKFRTSLYIKVITLLLKPKRLAMSIIRFESSGGEKCQR